MSRQTNISLAVAALVGISSIAFASSDALAYRQPYRSGYHGGMYHGGMYRGGVYGGYGYRGSVYPGNQYGLNAYRNNFARER
jgi:hypothetical protein